MSGVLLSLVARLEVAIDGSTYLNEQMNVVELACALVSWVHGGMRGDFVFISMEYDNGDLFNIIEVEKGWQIQSLAGRFDPPDLGTADVATAVLSMGRQILELCPPDIAPRIEDLLRDRH